MILKALGFMDFLVAVTVVLLHYDILIGAKTGMVFASYLFIKGIVFRGDLASIVDFIVGIYIVLLILGIQWGIVTYIVAIYLMQKVFFSFMNF
ncbi:MAG: hypothetical protein GY861_09810 [bacterium]|nr:hypothetical protein [bacterium]